MTQREWTGKEVALLRHHHGRHPVAAVARLLGRSVASVKGQIRRLGLNPRPAAPPAGMVRRLHAEGLTDARAGARLGVTRTGFARLRRLLGLPPNGHNPASRARGAAKLEARARALEHPSHSDYLHSRKRLKRLAEWPHCTTRAQVAVCRALHASGALPPGALARAIRGEACPKAARQAARQLLRLRVLAERDGLLMLAKRGKR